MNYKEIIEKIIKDTFNVIKEVYEYQKESNKESNAVQSPQKIGSRIIFPKNSNEEDRISEQELRFIFVEQFNKSEEVKENQLFYSVETPTKSFYYFSGEEGPKCIPDKEHNEHKGEEGAGRSGNIDLVIFQRNGKNVNRVALIEFKALNPVKKSYEKDFCKLNNEGESEGILKYFIQIVKNHDGRTIESINDKIKSKKDDVIYKCFCLGTGKEIGEEIINWKPEGE